MENKKNIATVTDFLRSCNVIYTSILHGYGDIKPQYGAQREAGQRRKSDWGHNLEGSNSAPSHAIWRMNHTSLCSMHSVHFWVVKLTLYSIQVQMLISCPVWMWNNRPPLRITVVYNQWKIADWPKGSQQSWNCKVDLKFEIVLKSQSLSTNVLILTVGVRAQWQFNVLLAALLICLLHMWIQF